MKNIDKESLENAYRLFESNDIESIEVLKDASSTAMRMASSIPFSETAITSITLTMGIIFHLDCNKLINDVKVGNDRYKHNRKVNT